MLMHVVLLQPKPETTEEQLTTALNHVEVLQKAIPGIIEVRAGKNMSNYNQGYTYGFVMQFLDNQHLIAYATHPKHQIVSKELQSICQKIIDFDIEP